MSRRDCVPMATSTHPTIFGPDPLVLDGRQGSRYWVHHPYGFTGNQVVDERLSAYPVAVFQPATRPTHETPIVLGLQGMAAPYQSNGFLVSTLLDMGIACVQRMTSWNGVTQAFGETRVRLFQNRNENRRP